MELSYLRRVQRVGHPVSAIQAALQTAGVAFIAENGGGPGVKLWKR
jgi:hypothetical protein